VDCAPAGAARTFGNTDAITQARLASAARPSHSTTMSLIHPISIGSVRTRTNLVLSPMSGVTDCAFRTLVRSCSGNAVGLVVSEFIAAEGLTRDNQKTLRMLRYKEAERPVSIQIFGADVDRMVRAAQMVEDAGADIVDINCGCPAPKVVRRGGGAQLMCHTDKLRDVIRGIRNSVSIPVTVKIRSGWDDDSLNALDVARMVEGEGAAMVAVHGRTRVQLYRGEADWGVVSEIRSKLSVPVVGSGDIVDPVDAEKRLRDGCSDAVMIGRGAMGNPWIFRQIVDQCEGRPVKVPSADDRVRAIRDFRDALRETAEDRAFIGRFRGLACRFVKGMRDGAAARRAIGEATTVDDAVKIFEEFVHGEPIERGNRAVA